MLLLKRILLRNFLVLLSCAVHIIKPAKLRGLVLEAKTDVLYPKDYFTITGTDKEFSVHDNKDGDVILPEDYYLLSAFGFTPGDPNKNTPQVELPAVNPDTDISTRVYLGCLALYHHHLEPHTAYKTNEDAVNKTRRWRLVEWSRGPTGPDDIYYNFYKDYYVADQVGKMNTYTGTAPKCHRLAYKVDGQVVNAPVHEELYEYPFLDYLKNRVRSYGTWSAFVKANPCFTTLSRFFGTTKIVALFAARPLMRGNDPNEKTEVELYRKDYVVMTELPPTWKTSREDSTLPERRTITEEPEVLSRADIETFDEEEMFSKLREEDEQRKKTSLLPLATGTTEHPYRNQWVGSLRTRVISRRPQTYRMSIVLPEQWTSKEEDFTQPGWPRPDTGRRKDNMKNVARLTSYWANYDAKEEPPHLNFTICHHCSNDGDNRGLPALSFYCHNLHEEPDHRFHPGSMKKSFRPGAKCVFDRYEPGFRADGQNTVISRRYRRGCMHQFLDVPSRYDSRSCRQWPPALSVSPFVGKRFQRLEKLLRFTADGCVSSPAASLTPFARGISLWVRYHVCVCSADYCNEGNNPKINIMLLLISFTVTCASLTPFSISLC
ncbi:uncharacterized protein LOC126381721 [Pectinophora gossypiella]|uniref:uncharacterized protein LOC126381721 n=1 Tax=Pectinophora gossypiella TaxID=13191 RepID=UPI00214E4BEC|nr:uncharacterized protein LOC126381721 [Pectinophora gossypiella]